MRTLRRLGKVTAMVVVFVFCVLALMVVGPFDALVGALGLRKKRRRRD